MGTNMTALLTNGLAVAHSMPRAYSTFRMAATSDGELVLEIRANDPALVLHQEHAGGYEAFTKKEFQQAHNGHGDDANIIQAFQMSGDKFRADMRTVGVGTNIYLSLADGIFQAVVQRSAPSNTPESVVNPGAFSRAAGGAKGNIAMAGVRETIEECRMCIVKSATTISLDFKFPRADVLASFVDACNKKKYTDTLFTNKIILKKDVLLQPLAIAGLTETVWQKFNDNNVSVLRNRVVFDDPKNGDLSGMDTINVIDLRGVQSSSIVIFDGEKDLEGNDLDRPWSLHRPEYLAEALNDDGMKFSGAPAKVIAQTPSVLKAIRTLGL